MPLVIQAANSIDGGEFPPIDAYADHEVALKTPSGIKFEGGTATADGVFPNASHSGVPGSNQHHVHAISYAGVVHRVSVSFLNGENRAGWIFYFPKAGASGTYSRYVSPSTVSKNDATALADDVFRAFFAACPTMPGKTANTAMLEQRNKSIAATAELKKQEEEKKATAFKKPAEVLAVKGYNGIFAQNSVAGGMSTEEALSRIEAYEKSGGVFMRGDQPMIKMALKDGKPKEAWSPLIRKYYDAIMAVKV